jgi:hypothetical protein
VPGSAPVELNTARTGAGTPVVSKFSRCTFDLRFCQALGLGLLAVRIRWNPILRKPPSIFPLGGTKGGYVSFFSIFYRIYGVSERDTRCVGARHRGVFLRDTGVHLNRPFDFLDGDARINHQPLAENAHFLECVEGRPFGKASNPHGHREGLNQLNSMPSRLHQRLHAPANVPRDSDLRLSSANRDIHKPLRVANRR